VLLGWRDTTIDVDIRLEPEDDAILRALVTREGRVTARHFDLYAQALAKLARNHELDRIDVRELLERGYVERDPLRARFDEIEPQLYLFPSIEPRVFRTNFERAIA